MREAAAEYSELSRKYIWQKKTLRIYTILHIQMQTHKTLCMYVYLIGERVKHYQG